MSDVLTITDGNSLPAAFENEIDNCNSSDKQYVIRSNVNNIEDIKKWVTNFGYLTNTQWNSFKSNPDGTSMVCMKKFVCHHSSFMKVDKELNKKGMSKNDNCPAFIKIKVKLTTRDTKKKDPFVKKGLPAVITISKSHSHSLNSAQALRCLQDSAGYLQATFDEYFSDGMGASEALRYHEGVLECIQAPAEDFVNGNKKPTIRTVSYWYDLWRNVQLGPRDGVVEEFPEDVNRMSDNNTETTNQEIAEPVVAPCSPLTERRKTKEELLVILHEKLSEKVYKLSSDTHNIEGLMEKYITTINNINTVGQLIRFFVSGPRRIKTGAKILVRRRKPRVNKSSNRLTAGKNCGNVV